MLHISSQRLTCQQRASLQPEQWQSVPVQLMVQVSGSMMAAPAMGAGVGAGVETAPAARKATRK